MFTSFLHPLATFPTLLSFGLISPLLLRLAVGGFVIYLGWKRLQKEYQGASIAYIVTGALVVLGLYTQIASLISIVILKLDFYADHYWTPTNSPASTEKYVLYFFAIVILLSLLLTGPGLFAFDLPL